MDKELCEKLYVSYYMQVFSYVMVLCGNRDLAEEITQETFFRVMKSDKATFRGESKVETWLCSIARNLYTDELRRRNHIEQMPEELPEQESFESQLEDKENSFRIHMILHCLEDPYREVFELRVFGELSFAQIGTIFAKTENWARVTYHRARLKIQERMEKNDE